MSDRSPATGGGQLQAHNQSNKKASDAAKARRREEAEKAARRQRVRALCAAALDNANAIYGGDLPPSSGDMADALLQWHDALAVNKRLGWVDALRKLDARPFRLFILDKIRDASPKTRRATALRLKVDLSEPKLCWDFWNELMVVGGAFWNWLQEGVPESGPEPRPVVEYPAERSAEVDAGQLQFASSSSGLSVTFSELPFAPLPSCPLPDDIRSIAAALAAIPSILSDQRSGESVEWPFLIKRLHEEGYCDATAEWVLCLAHECCLIAAYNPPVSVSSTGKIVHHEWRVKVNSALGDWAGRYRKDPQAEREIVANSALRFQRLKVDAGWGTRIPRGTAKHIEPLEAATASVEPIATTTDRFAEFARKSRKLLQFLVDKKKVPLADAHRAVYGRQPFDKTARNTFLALVRRTSDLLLQKRHKLAITLEGETLEMIAIP